MSFSDNKKPKLVPVYQAPPEIEITPGEVDKLDHNTIFNDVYAEYYDQLAEDTGDDKYKKNARRMRNCHKMWFGDHYIIQEMFDVKNVSLCHDRYCVNCLHLKQAAMLQKFTKILENAAANHDLYFMTMTVPNCPLNALGDALDRFKYAFGKIIRYFTGDIDVAGINFADYGFHAAYRNIEIVPNPNSFHPHYHVILALRKGLDERKLYTNDYSYDHGVLSRKFSDLEILIQKLLALGYNKIRLDKIVVNYVLNGVEVDEKKLLKFCEKYKVDRELLTAIRKEGYSCVIDKIEDDSWHDAFKYATKLTKDGAPLLSYYQFAILVEKCGNKHFGQGYGAWYKLPQDDWEIDEEILKAYEKVIAHLKEIEDPVGYTFEILELREQMKKRLRCISRKKAYKLVQEFLKDDEHADLQPTANAEVPEEDPEQTKHEQMRMDLSYSFDDDDLPF